MNFNRLYPSRLQRPGFDRYFVAVPGVAARDAHDWQPPVDVLETDDNYRVEVELPAVEAKDVQIRVEDGLLTVSGERGRPDAASERTHRTERRFGKFARRFRLPDDADSEAIRATAAHGVLTITVDKAAKARPRAIEIESH